MTEQTSRKVDPWRWPASGQDRCYDEAGRERPCAGSGQDGAYRLGIPWPTPLFHVQGETVIDRRTGLTWCRDADINGFPLSWDEAFALVAELNRNGHGGYRDWRLPNRRELRSLVSYRDKKPALPAGHPFTNVFLGWYWSSTTAAIHPAYAWCLHMEGARLFYGNKKEEAFCWPVRGVSPVLARTGQRRCFAADGRQIPCSATGQDGELRLGRPWPQPRFQPAGQVVHDRLTGLVWCRRLDLAPAPLSWAEALAMVTDLNRTGYAGRRDWRLPDVNALESLVDCDCHSPALPAGHPFSGQPVEGYWSATTSFFETDWAWVLYLAKGALGVGHKPGRDFGVWPVAGG